MIHQLRLCIERLLWVISSISTSTKYCHLSVCFRAYSGHSGAEFLDATNTPRSVLHHCLAVTSSGLPEIRARSLFHNHVSPSAYVPPG